MNLIEKYLNLFVLANKKLNRLMDKIEDWKSAPDKYYRSLPQNQRTPGMRKYCATKEGYRFFPAVIAAVIIYLIFVVFVCLVLIGTPLFLISLYFSITPFPISILPFSLIIVFAVFHALKFNPPQAEIQDSSRPKNIDKGW